MSINLDELTKPFPREAIKQRRGGGGKALDYVEGHSVIHRLNAATGNQWSFRVLDITSRTITTDRGQSTLLTAKVELEIAGLGARQHIGVQMVSDAGGEDLAKGVITDGLKKAATLFGVGLELYGPDYESGELPAPRHDAPQARQRPDNRRYAAAAMNSPETPQAGVQDNVPANMSPKQEGFIRALIHDLEWPREEVERFLSETYGVNRISQLPRQDVSRFIDRLQELKAANEPAPVV